MINKWTGYRRNYSYGDSFIKRLLSTINVWVLVAILLIVAVGLTGYSIKTGGYVKILERNVTSLQDQLKACSEQTEITNTDLETCNSNLQNKITALTTCQNKQSDLGDSLSECQNDLNICGADYDALQEDYDSLQEKLDGCKSDLSNMSIWESKYNSMSVNYAGDKCCPLNNTYYTISNNQVLCSASSGIPISC
jgi:uncharacterized protein HemX